MTELQVTAVDLDGILSLLGAHLYSSPEVVVRELVQNAHDSIVRRGTEDPSFRGGIVRLVGDPAARTLSVHDDGAGMTEDEVRQHLATIGAGATGAARVETESSELIGQFGVGFLSAFAVGRRVTVTTTSWRHPEQTWEYQSVGGRQYSLRPVATRPCGTTVAVELSDDAAFLADPAVLRGVTTRYCVLLHLDVFIGDDAEPINLTPPWLVTRDDAVAEHPVAATRSRLDFAAAFEPAEPVCTIDLDPTAESDARGLLWVQSTRSYGSMDNRNLRVFVRGMLLDDDARELLPDWAGFVGGVIESVELRPTASREDLQRGREWYALRELVQDQLVGGLQRLAREQRPEWRRTLARHNENLLGAAIADPSLFALMADSLTVATTEGDLLPREIARRGGGRIHLGLGDAGGFEETVFRAMKVPIAAGSRYGVAPFLRRWAGERRVELVELGTASGDRTVFRPERLPDADVEWLHAALASPGEALVVARFAPVTLPLVCVPDREVELKERVESDTADARIGRSALALARSHTAGIDGTVRRRVFVNLDCPSISRLLALAPEARPQTAVSLLRSLKGLTAGPSAGGDDLNEALGLFSDVLLDLLGSDR